ncbi:MAG: hypothetical protein ACXWQO_17265 [Bdellovibrionota bacterium]
MENAATQDHTPKQPENSFRIVLTVNKRMPRLDALLLEAIRAQDKNDELKRISRTVFKGLFNDKKILIKGQAAKPSSSLATGTTYVDILGYSESGAVGDL